MRTPHPSLQTCRERYPQAHTLTAFTIARRLPYRVSKRLSSPACTQNQSSRHRDSYYTNSPSAHPPPSGLHLYFLVTPGNRLTFLHLHRSSPALSCVKKVHLHQYMHSEPEQSPPRQLRIPTAPSVPFRGSPLLPRHPW